MPKLFTVCPFSIASGLLLSGGVHADHLFDCHLLEQQEDESESWIFLVRSVTGGCPQGSILRVFLFNLIMDDLDDEFSYVEQVGRLETRAVNGEEEEDDFHVAKADDPEKFHRNYLEQRDEVPAEESFASAVSDQDDTFYPTFILTS